MKELLLLVTQIVLMVFSEDYPNSTCGDRCCLNFYKDWFHGRCVECPLGTHGLDCSGTCPPQYYGRFCNSKCDCPLHFCDRKFGCIYIPTKNGGNNPWKYVAFTLIGSITTAVAVGLIVFTRPWMIRKCKQEIKETDESQLGMSSIISNGNFIEENKYEENQSSPSRDETEAIHLYNMFAENNYAELRTSALSPIYNSPDDFNTDLMHRTLMLTRPGLKTSNK